MAFTRSVIRNLAKESGVELPKELEDALVSEHLAARAAYAEEQVKAELAKQPEAKAESVKDSDEYKALQNEFSEFRTAVEKKEAQAAKESAYRAALKDANLSEKGIEKAVKYAEWDKIEVDSDGKLKDAKSHIKGAREEWAEFVVTTATTGAETASPPTNTGGTGLTKADIYKKDDKGRYVLSTAERQKALAENPNIMKREG